MAVLHNTLQLMRCETGYIHNLVKVHTTLIVIRRRCPSQLSLLERSGNTVKLLRIDVHQSYKSRTGEREERKALLFKEWRGRE